jgi:hypothetical protein
MRSALATLPGSSKPNEDFVAATGDLAVVLDGATTPAHLDTGCSHGTRWFSHALGAEIVRRLTTEPGPSLADGLAASITSLAARHAATCDVTHPGHPSATVALLRETPEALEYLVLADATVAIETRSGIEVFSDARVEQAAARQHADLAARPLGAVEHAAALADLTTALRGYRNRPDGFWVAAVEPQAAYEALSGRFDRSEVSSAAVLTDGASILADRFRVMDWPETFRTLRKGGPAELLHRVREVEAGDAAGTRWPRGKVHDDATVVYCVPSESGGRL